MTRRLRVRIGAAATAVAAATAGVVGLTTNTASGEGAAVSVAGHPWGDGLPGRPAASVADAERQAAAAFTAQARPGQTLVLVTRTLREAEVDVGRRGFSPGDFFLFEERVFDRSGTRAIGIDSVRCEASIRTFTCEATVKLNGRGKIRVAGSLFMSDRAIVVPVTGGTGNFQGVGGELTVFDLDNGDTALIFHLVR